MLFGVLSGNISMDVRGTASSGWIFRIVMEGGYGPVVREIMMDRSRAVRI